MISDSHGLPYKSQVSREGQKIGKYVLSKKLGEGQYGTVWRAHHLETGAIFAIKKVDRSQIDSSHLLKRLLQTEVSIMHEIDHPNIMRLYDLLASSRNYYLVMQYCNQSDFESYIKEKKVKYFVERDAVHFLQQIMNGFFELRKRKILHRDFKLANIFVHDERLIIGDFGFAKSGFDIGETRLGSPLTMAPELLFSRDDDLIYNSKADLWSIGVVFYQLLFGNPPFWGKNVAELKRSILENSGANLKFPRMITSQAKDLLTRLLTLDPNLRIEWRHFFNHDLFSLYQNSDDSIEISKVFGLRAVKQIALARKEFEKNKTEETSDKNVQFYNDEQFVNLGRSMEELRVSEEEIGLSLEDRIQTEQIASEIFFRYNHELNKIYFQVYTARKLQSFLKEDSFPSLKSILMHLSLTLLRQAMLVNTDLVRDLKSKKNVLNLNDFAFETFCSNSKYHEIVTRAEINTTNLKAHSNLLLRRFKGNGISLVYPELASQSKMEDRLLNRYIALETLKMREVNASVDICGNDSEKIRKFCQMTVILKYSQNLSANFPYLLKNSRSPKFNWDGFYYTIERATAEELRALL